VAQPADEQSWIESARVGNASERSEAVGRLYERYFDRIYKYIYLKLGDPTEAEDVCEQVFLKMIESIGTFQWQGSTFASWLYRIAHNQVVDTLRRHSRRPQVPLEPAGESLTSERDDPHHLAEQSDFRDHVREAISGLTDLQAQVILLKFGAGLSNAEVAAILDRTEGAIKALQYSALQNLQKRLVSRGYERSSN
jgi:RNA polymerase sigma-70 factor (ECF subfamily)